jgi:hypothetical protein
MLSGCATPKTRPAPSIISPATASISTPVQHLASFVAIALLSSSPSCLVCSPVRCKNGFTVSANFPLPGVRWSPPAHTWHTPLRINIIPDRDSRILADSGDSRMYRDTDEREARDAAAKPDRTSAARRSVIRREATVRPSRSPQARASSSSSSSEDHRSRLVRRRRLSNQRQIEHLEAELERLRRNQTRSRVQGELENESRIASTHPRGEDAARGIDMRPRETTYTVPHNVDPAQLLRPSRESALRFVEMSSSGNLANDGSTSPRRYRTSGPQYMPSPRYSLDRDRRTRRSLDGPWRPVEQRPMELAPNFAPAPGMYHRTPQPSDAMGTTDVWSYSLHDTPPPEEWEGPYPPLRRVDHLSPRPPTHRTNYDGLGDRRRSMSPHSSDSHEDEESWEILMNTMDRNHRHSVQTSTARSDTASRSNQSSQTAATSFGEIGQIDDTCDLDLPYGITEEDARELRARHERNERRAIDNHDMARDVRRNLEIIERRSAELSMFQNILERMQRRQEIPAEWWAAVGLSPILSDSLPTLMAAGTGAAGDQREESRANA